MRKRNWHFWDCWLLTLGLTNQAMEARGTGAKPVPSQNEQEWTNNKPTMPMRHNFPILEQQNNINQTCNYPRRETAGVNKRNARQTEKQQCPWTKLRCYWCCASDNSFMRGPQRDESRGILARLVCRRALIAPISELLATSGREPYKNKRTSEGLYACGWRWGGWLADLNPLATYTNFGLAIYTCNSATLLPIGRDTNDHIWNGWRRNNLRCPSFSAVFENVVHSLYPPPLTTMGPGVPLHHKCCKTCTFPYQTRVNKQQTNNANGAQLSEPWTTKQHQSNLQLSSAEDSWR